ncbi:MAG: amine dehydrogenase [Gammaproteobacteria bacterium]|nr:amine dehydrogenase [Gammaproteobacteria bacterium]
MRTLAGAALLLLAAAVPASADLPVEPIGVTEKLPARWPDTWIQAHDINFYALSDGKVVIFDVAAENRNYKGSISAAQFASFIASTTRPEIYVAETYYSQRVRGTRHDVITVHDKSTLAPVAEIPLPGGKRGQYVTFKNTLQLLNDENWLAVYNFSPAATVSIVDVAARRIIGEASVAGCAMIYPTGTRNFMSLCSEGVMLVTALAETGAVAKQWRTPAFFNADDDPLFAMPTMIGRMAYFPTFHGNIQPLDLSGDEPKVLLRWSLLNDADRKANWRPGGWQIAAAHRSGRLYVLMHPDGYNGSHKNGGPEVWVFDVGSGKRVARHVLKNRGVSIEVTSGAQPYLVVTNDSFQLDVYDAGDGKWLRMFGDHAVTMPMVLHAVQ